MKTRSQLGVGAVVAVVALSSSLSACSANGGDDGEWPPSTLQLIIPSTPGGGLDTTSRRMEKPVEDELGYPLEFNYQPGGGFSIALQRVLDTGDDCSAVVAGAQPIIHLSYMTQTGIDYTYEDFAGLAVVQREPSVLRVPNDAPYEDLNDLIEDAKARPGKIRASVTSSADPFVVATAQLQTAADIELSTIPYEGGSEARLAVASGEADVSVAGAESSLDIDDDTRVLAVFAPPEIVSDLPEEMTDGARSWNDTMGLSTDELPDASFTNEWYASAECRENYPDRFRELQEAFATAGQSDAYADSLKTIGEKATFFYADGEAIDTRAEEIADSLPPVLDASGLLVGSDG